jgi:hypothetical protein
MKWRVSSCTFHAKRSMIGFLPSVPPLELLVIICRSSKAAWVVQGLRRVHSLGAWRIHVRCKSVCKEKVCVRPGSFLKLFDAFLIFANDKIPPAVHGSLGLVWTTSQWFTFVFTTFCLPYSTCRQADLIYRITRSRVHSLQTLSTAACSCGVSPQVYLSVGCRYFSQQQLRDLFTVTPEGLETSSTQQHLHKLHAGVV